MGKAVAKTELYAPVNLGTRVEVYLSLSKKYPLRWIVRTHSNAPSSRNRTYLNGQSEVPGKELTRTVGLRNCEFFVYDAKRQSNLMRGKQGRKDVFAWVVGDLVDPEEVRAFCTREVTYHMRHPAFRDVNGLDIHTADVAFFTCIADRFRLFVPG